MPARLRLVLVSVALLVSLLVAGFALQNGALFLHPLWLDEWHTVLVSRQNTLRDVMSVLTQGADFNPPLLFVMHWVIGQFGGDLGQVQMRTVSLLSVWLTLVGLFTLLRGPFRDVAAVTGVVAVAMNYNVIIHAFEARFYGPWMLLTVLHVGLVAWATETPISVRKQSAACCSAILLCLIHYFGIITLGLVSLGVAFVRRPSRGWLWALAPSVIAGVATAVALIPMFEGQRAALSVPTWVPAASPLLIAYFIAPSLLILIASLPMLLPVIRGRQSDPPVSAQQRAVVAGLASLALLPTILVLVSLVFQSVLVSRYVLPSLLALAPVVAAIVARLQRRARIALLGVLTCTWIITCWQQARVSAEFTENVRTDSINLRQALRSEAVVVMPSRFVLYPLFGTLRQGNHHVALADVPRANIRQRFPQRSDSAVLGDIMIVERDVARVHGRVFGQPNLITLDSLGRLGCFLVLESTDNAVFMSRWMPSSRAIRIRPRLFLVITPASRMHSDSLAACTSAITG